MLSWAPQLILSKILRPFTVFVDLAEVFKEGGFAPPALSEYLCADSKLLSTGWKERQGGCGVSDRTIIDSAWGTGWGLQGLYASAPFRPIRPILLSIEDYCVQKSTIPFFLVLSCLWFSSSVRHPYIRGK